MSDDREITMPFGKFKGTRLRELPEHYLTWLTEEAEVTSERLREALTAEVARRQGGIGETCPTCHRPLTQTAPPRPTPRPRQRPFPRPASSSAGPPPRPEDSEVPF